MSTDAAPVLAAAVADRTRLRRALLRLAEGGIEQRAVQAGEIDAVIDYSSASVILFPAARRALRVAADRAAVTYRKRLPGAAVANSVLAALPAAEYQRLRPALEPVVLEFGAVLHEPDAAIHRVYFPVDCVVCLSTQVDRRATVETGLIGYEGVVGLSVALGFSASPVRAMVRVGGIAWVMMAAHFSAAVLRCPPMQRELYRCAAAELAQARQAAAGAASLLLEQRLAGRLLMTSDRSRSVEILLTQEDLATAFNVRRESITAASGTLRARRLISYHRGRIEILDRKGLEAAAGLCYLPIGALRAA